MKIKKLEIFIITILILIVVFYLNYINKNQEITECPSCSPIEIIKEITVIEEVIKEVPVEVIRNVEVEVIKYVEVPVEKIVYQDRIVYQEVEVIKEVIDNTCQQELVLLNNKYTTSMKSSSDEWSSLLDQSQVIIKGYYDLTVRLQNDISELVEMYLSPSAASYYTPLYIPEPSYTHCYYTVSYGVGQLDCY